MNEIDGRGEQELNYGEGVTHCIVPGEQNEKSVVECISERGLYGKIFSWLGEMNDVSSLCQRSRSPYVKQFID